MSDMFKDIRDRIDKKPKWIGERVWEGLKAYWSSPEFKGKSAVNTVNRHSDVGGFTHTGGSINANESKRRLVRNVTLNIGYYAFSLFQLNIVIFCFLFQEADMKHEVDPADFFVYRHKYKQGPKKGEWVDSRSQTVHVSYIMLYVCLIM